MRFDFYQLTRDPPEAVVPLLAEKIVQKGERALVLSADAARLAAISDALWRARPASFLAHGIVGEDGLEAARQPILLSDRMEAANDAANLIVADGEWREVSGGFARIFYLFTPQRVEEARAAWRALGEREDASRHFWEQAEGRWIERG